jgi:hypothetical protein
MDLDFLLNIVKCDDRGNYPSAERMLRHMMGDPWCRAGKGKKVSMVQFPKISDPEGLIRSIKSERSCVGGHKTTRQHTRNFR